MPSIISLCPSKTPAADRAYGHWIAEGKAAIEVNATAWQEHAAFSIARVQQR